MARVLPNSSPSGSKLVHKVHQVLRKLPDSYTIWHRLSIYTTPGPDFMVITETGRAILLKVAPVTQDEAKQSRQPGFFDTLLGRKGAGQVLGQAEHDALTAFHSQLNQTGPMPLAMPFAVLFPNVAAEILKHSLIVKGLLVAAKDDLDQGLEAWMERHLSAPLSTEQLESLRRAFTPEAIVPAALTTRQPINRNTQATLQDFLLDYDQEWATKLDLDLSEEAHAQIQTFGVRLINGVAGSGKSLIILYRARLLHQLFPQKRILVTTHNKALMRDLEARYGRLGGNGQQVEWLNFHAWCYARLHGVGAWQNPIRPKERQLILEKVHQDILAESSITLSRFQDELEWYKDQLLFSREAYLAANRKGRGFQLQGSMREKMYDAFEAYQMRLGSTRMDWGDVPRRTYELLRTGRIRPTPYDVILIDEAQFFAPIWFEIVKQVLKPGGHLFMVADATQGFLKRGQSWLASGLDVRGRSARLERSYRTTRAILGFAVRFYEARQPVGDEEIVTPSLHTMPDGVPPEVLAFTSEQDELIRLTEELRRFHAAGHKLGHVLVIHPTWEGMDRILRHLRKVFGMEAASDPRERMGDGFIRVCTLDAVTGLEAPLVFILGLHRLLEREADIALSDDERTELIRDNTRRIYMAITRAGQRVVLSHVGSLPISFFPEAGAVG